MDREASSETCLQFSMDGEDRRAPGCRIWKASFDGNSLFFGPEPCRLQAFPKVHACAIKNDPAIGRGHAQFLTDIAGVPCPSALASRTRARPGPGAGHCIGRTLPRNVSARNCVRGPARPAAKYASGRFGPGQKKVVGKIAFVFSVRSHWHLRFTRLPAKQIDDLVPEYPGQPGSERGAAGEITAAFHGRKQRFLHHVVGVAGIADLQ